MDKLNIQTHLKNKGLFIAFEGLDNSGKSVQARLLADKLKDVYGGDRVNLTKEPGDTSTELTKDCRKYLANREQYKVDSVTAAFLYLADRSYHVQQIIKPSLQKNQIVITDRYYHSMIAYQSDDVYFPMHVLDDLNRKATDNLNPDVVVFMDTDFNVMMQRRELRSQKETNDSMPRQKMEEIWVRYRFMLKDNPRTIWIQDHGNRTSAQISEEIFYKINKLF